MPPLRLVSILALLTIGGPTGSLATSPSAASGVGAPRAAAGFGLAVIVSGESQELTKAEADQMGGKLAAILSTGELPRPPAAPPVRTSFTDREANAYFRHYGSTFLPAGVVSPQVTIAERGRVSARALVDLDAVRNSQPRGWLDPLRYVTGMLEVTASGIVAGSNGTGVFQFESATLAGVPVSKGLLQELVRYYTTTPEQPNGFDLDKPFDLPSGIRSVASSRGSAVITQ